MNRFIDNLKDMWFGFLFVFIYGVYKWDKA